MDKTTQSNLRTLFAYYFLDIRLDDKLISQIGALKTNTDKTNYVARLILNHPNFHKADTPISRVINQLLRIFCERKGTLTFHQQQEINNVTKVLKTYGITANWNREKIESLDYYNTISQRVTNVLNIVITQHEYTSLLPNLSQVRNELAQALINADSITQQLQNRGQL